MRILLASLTLFFGLAALSALGSPLKVLTSPSHEAQGLPFSEAVEAGGLIFVSGQIAAKPGSLALVPGGIENQTRQVMDNIKNVLERHGSSMDHVVKCTVFIQDMAQWPAMNAVYLTYFPNHKPARSAVGANGIALGGLVEIECIAAAG
ncbi:MAG: 2-iminobutanoate/2-iminopropanoate deaminase [Limisphaerales bacterium]|jgi:2-iminobutanoate/2-iminopropanoate deaminase